MVEYQLKTDSRKPNKRTFIPEIGYTYGNFTVLDSKFYKNQHSNHNYIKVKCKCGFTTYERLDQLNKNLRTGCFECNHTYKKRDYKQIGNLSCRMFSEIRRNAEIRNIDFEVTMEDMWNLFLEQESKCALTGIDLALLPLYYNTAKYNQRQTISRKEITASLDRIDPAKGYALGNLQWVHKGVNIMKNCLTNSEFINLCKLIAQHHSNYNDNFEPSQLTGYLRRYIYKKSTR